MVDAVVAMVVRMVEVAAGREEAGCSCCAGGSVRAGAMVGLAWLRRLLGSVGTRRGIPEGGEGVVGAPGDDIGVVVGVEALARGAGAGEVVLPELALEDVRWCQTLEHGRVGPAVEEEEDEDRPLFDDAQGG